MYFEDRAEAGKKLAQELLDYRVEDTVVMALSEGGVAVGAEIADKLRCGLTLLLTKEVKLPGNNSSTVGVIDHEGGFTYDEKVAEGHLEALLAEFHGYIDEQKLHKRDEMSRLVGNEGLVTHEDLEGKNVILVNDAFITGTTIDAAISYMKPIKTKKIIGVTPFASVKAVDKLHLFCDELKVLNVTETVLPIDHYYNETTRPDNKEVAKILKDNIYL